MMKRLSVVAAALFCTLCGYAQSRTDEYGVPLDDDNDYAPEIYTDTTLFYRAARQADDLFATMTGHRLSFVENRRRNIGYRQTEAIYAGIRLPVQYARTLRSLGAAHSAATAADAVAAGSRVIAGTEVWSFGQPYADKAPYVGATFSDRGYSAGIRAAFSATFGNGWSLDAAAAARTGRDLHVDGVFTNSAGAALRVARRFAGGAEFSLLAAAEPSMRGLRSASSAEAFALTGNNLYNPSWGWQDGRQRNSRVRREMTPLAVVSYSLPLGESTALTATLAAEAGTRRQSSLGWYDAATPAPDNYRYMPSWFTNDDSAATVAALWRAGDTRYTQIDWDELYRVNRMSDRGAVYAQDDRVRRTTNLQAALSVSSNLGRGLNISGGVTAASRTERRYRQMRDLLGAAYLTDIDYYLVDDDSYSNSLQNDLRNPDRTIREGDRFGYDFALLHRTVSLHAAAEYHSGRFDIRAAGCIGGESVHRRGYYEKELFPGSGSFGNSAKMTFASYGAAAEAGYAFTPKYRIGIALHASAAAPDAEELFLNPQYNNRTVTSPRTERRTGAELNGSIVTRTLRMQAVLFAESQRGGIRTMQYYDDLAEAFCDMTVSGIDIDTYGIEAAASIRIASRWHLDAAITAFQCRYASDPAVEIFTDSSNKTVDAGSASHMGDCVPGGVPRLAASLTAGYRSPNGWSFGVTAAWAGARRAEPSFLRRTERVAYQGSSSPESFAAIVGQESLPDAFNADLNISKRWFTRRNSRITATLTVHNLPGLRDNIYSAYESHRVRRVARGIQSEYVPLPTRYLYAYPRTVAISASYTF